MIDSCTIKRDPNNDMHKGNDIETVIKEGDEEEPPKEFGQPRFSYLLIKGDTIKKPEDGKSTSQLEKLN